MKVKVAYTIYGEVEINIPDKIEYDTDTVPVEKLDPSEFYELVEEAFDSLSEGTLRKNVDLAYGDAEIMYISGENDEELWAK